MTNYEWLNGMNIIQREKEITKWYDQAKIKLVLYNFWDWLQQEHEPDLKPCPFCGGKAELLPYGKTGNYTVICRNDKCQASFILPVFSRVDAIKAWNERAGDEEW